MLTIAQQEQRILITEDRDFGELVFRRRRPHTGVIYLRLPPMELKPRIARVQEVLDRYSDRLDQFVVVTEKTVRVRRSEGEFLTAT